MPVTTAGGSPDGIDQTRRERTPLFRLWSGLSASNKRPIAIGAILLSLMLLAVGLTLSDLYRVALRDVHQNVGKLGIAVAEQTVRSIQTVDLAIEEIRNDIIKSKIDTRERFTSQVQNSGMHATLRQKKEALPQADAFTIIGADGKLVNSSRQWPVPVTDLADRDYYNFFRDNDDQRPFVSKPVQNRGTGEWTVYIVRRVNGPDGTFLGLVLGSLELSYFRDFYQALTAGTGTVISLRKNDSAALTMFPPAGQPGDVLPGSSPWHAIAAAGSAGSFATDGRLGIKERVISVHPLLGYPLVVSVSVSEWASLANWRRAAMVVAIGAGSATICVVMLLHALLLQLRRLERTRHRMEVQAEELLASREHLAVKSTTLETTLHHMNQGIIMVQADRTVAVCNTQAIRMLDLPPELMGSNPSFDALVHHQHSMGEFNDEDTPPWVGLGDMMNNPLTYERRRPNGRILEIQSVPLSGGGMVRTYTDITERRTAEQNLRYHAHHDDLTKLVNRSVFQDRLNQAIELADRGRSTLAVLYLDLDGFKQINDVKGHGVGDRLLVQVAERLRGAIRVVDTVARMGGDEFAIIQPNIDQTSASIKLCERLLDRIKQPFDIDGMQCSVGVSIGIAHYPQHAACAADLLRNADTALYRAKASGRGGYCTFDTEMDTQLLEVFTLEQELRQALNMKQFEVEYQPIVETTARHIVCFEALLRWRHPQLGMVEPVKFIGLAERSRLIIPIGLWVIEAACAEATEWPAEICLSVNVSPVQFSQDDFVEAVIRILHSTRLASQRLILEITEGVLLNQTDRVLESMVRLRALGVRFSLDDFGVAHAGLSYLGRFPFDIIKIDKLFVKNMALQAGARAIITAVLGIGAAHGMVVIAEGVESEEQFQRLVQMDCKQVQGYLTGRPGSGVKARRSLAHACDEGGATPG